MTRIGLTLPQNESTRAEANSVQLFQSGKFSGVISITAAAPIKWVDFDVSYEALHYAMEQDIRSAEQEKHISWIDILALAACRTGGRCDEGSVRMAAADLQGDRSARELVGDNTKYFDYYHEAYTAALGGLLGNFAIEKDGQWINQYGLFTHCGRVWLQPQRRFR